MNFTGKAQETAERVIEAFKSGNIPEPLSHIFINVDEVPMSQWSYLNQFVCLISGCTDARGFKQWQEVNRNVKRGEKAAAYILVPLKKKRKKVNKDQDEEQDSFYIYGFRGMPVFDVSQTEGESLPVPDDHQEFIDALPLTAVSEQFGISLKLFNARGKSSAGFYTPGRNIIGLGVENLSTWLHELIHAADDKLGNLKEKGQHWRSETVAELGSTTLAIMIGREDAADVGGAWEYISAYAQAANIETITACVRVLERTCQAISLILETAENLN